MRNFLKASKETYDKSSQILVIDDDSIILKFFKIHLNKFFSKVAVAKNAAEAMSILKEKEIDLIIADVFMPKTNGIQLAKKVRRFDITIPTLLISGVPLDPKAEEELKVADGFLKKPFDIEDLHTFIRKGLEKRQKYKDLAVLLKNQETLKELFKSKVKLEEHVPAENMEEAQQLIQELAS